MWLNRATSRRNFHRLVPQCSPSYLFTPSGPFPFLKRSDQERREATWEKRHCVWKSTLVGGRENGVTEGKHVLRAGPEAAKVPTTRFCLTFKKQNGFQMHVSSPVRLFLLEEAHTLQCTGAMRSLHFQVVSILIMDKPADLNVAAFPLACVFNVQHVSLQFFKHERKIRSHVQVTVTPGPTNSKCCS